MTFKTMTVVATDWDSLDAELARWLRTRTTLRAERDREASPLDDVAMALRRVRATLAFVASTVSEDDAPVAALISRSYRWSIRVARELEAIEQLAVEPMAEWSRFEAFAPFALAFFDSVLAAPLGAAPKSSEIARLRREIDAVLSPLATAMTSSALAA